MPEQPTTTEEKSYIGFNLPHSNYHGQYPNAFWKVVQINCMTEQVQVNLYVWRDYESFQNNHQKIDMVEITRNSPKLHDKIMDRVMLRISKIPEFKNLVKIEKEVEEEE